MKIAALPVIKLKAAASPPIFIIYFIAFASGITIFSFFNKERECSWVREFSSRGVPSREKTT